MEPLILVITFLAALGSGLIAGLFFIFSVTVDRVPWPQSLRRPASPPCSPINRTIVAPPFLSVFFGTAMLTLRACGGIGLALGRTRHRMAAGRRGDSILIGGIAVTMAFNVPLNNALDRVAPDSAEGAKLWGDHLVEWTRWTSAHGGVDGATPGLHASIKRAAMRLILHLGDHRCVAVRRCRARLA